MDISYKVKLDLNKNLSTFFVGGASVTYEKNSVRFKYTLIFMCGD